MNQRQPEFGLREKVESPRSPLHQVHRIFMLATAIVSTSLVPASATIESGVTPACLTVSPDGKKLAFTTVRNGCVFSLWRMNTDGTGLTQLISEVDQPVSPAWSSDSAGIVAVTNDPSRSPQANALAPASSGIKSTLKISKSGLWLVEGTKSRQVPVGGQITDPLWSPDGRQAYCISTWFRQVGNGDLVYYGDVYVITSHGGSVHRLTHFAPALFRSTSAEVTALGVLSLGQITCVIAFIALCYISPQIWARWTSASSR